MGFVGSCNQPVTYLSHLSIGERAFSGLEPDPEREASLVIVDGWTPVDIEEANRPHELVDLAKSAFEIHR